MVNGYTGDGCGKPTLKALMVKYYHEFASSGSKDSSTIESVEAGIESSTSGTSLAEMMKNVDFTGYTSTNVQKDEIALKGKKLDIIEAFNRDEETWGPLHRALIRAKFSEPMTETCCVISPRTVTIAAGYIVCCPVCLWCYSKESVPPVYEKQTLYVTAQGLYDHTSDLLAWDDIQSLPELKTDLTVNAPLGVGFACPCYTVPCPQTSVPGATGFTLTSKSQQTKKFKQKVRKKVGNNFQTKWVDATQEFPKSYIFAVGYEHGHLLHAMVDAGMRGKLPLMTAPSPEVMTS
eukprot:CAMPEP_0197844386 /NCGR_PEP_ID=MMETSP1438-20131217/1372_1 /TAXON_ID=1461541 /ORGANISM="Pterosperma sp., Strain CCMP1384" /LENGTH=290 /DNA_ID=CAMNT_0043455147 /DNA_START=150 /DNA_END=1022 /DNA_ORIENTATION=-